MDLTYFSPVPCHNISAELLHPAPHPQERNVPDLHVSSLILIKRISLLVIRAYNLFQDFHVKFLFLGNTCNQLINVCPILITVSQYTISFDYHLCLLNRSLPTSIYALQAVQSQIVTPSSILAMQSSFRLQEYSHAVKHVYRDIL